MVCVCVSGGGGGGGGWLDRQTKFFPALKLFLLHMDLKSSVI